MSSQEESPQSNATMCVHASHMQALSLASECRRQCGRVARWMCNGTGPPAEVGLAQSLEVTGEFTAVRIPAGPDDADNFITGACCYSSLVEHIWPIPSTICICSVHLYSISKRAEHRETCLNPLLSGQGFNLQSSKLSAAHARTVYMVGMQATFVKTTAGTILYAIPW